MLIAFISNCADRVAAYLPFMTIADLVRET